LKVLTKMPSGFSSAARSSVGGETMTDTVACICCVLIRVPSRPRCSSPPFHAPGALGQRQDRLHVDHDGLLPRAFERIMAAEMVVERVVSRPATVHRRIGFLEQDALRAGIHIDAAHVADPAGEGGSHDPRIDGPRHVGPPDAYRRADLVHGDHVGNDAVLAADIHHPDHGDGGNAERRECRQPPGGGRGDVGSVSLVPLLARVQIGIGRLCHRHFRGFAPFHP
jgi:hypothetical protein